MVKTIRSSVVQLGGAAIGQPSPAGTWSSQYDMQTVDFDRDAFTRMLADKGYSVLWERATWCPNRPAGMLKPRDHDITCSICDGTGFLYYAAETTPMLMTGMTMQQSFNAYGRWDAGQQMVTALPEKRLFYWDRLTLQNGITRFFEMTTRQPDTNEDRLKYAPLGIEHVSWVDRTKMLRVYTLDQDFEVTATGIRWLIEKGLPDDNKTYSIAYTIRPRYVVQDLVHHHRDSTIQGTHYEFPTTAVAKLDYLTRDESKDAPQVQYQDPFKQ